MHVDNRIEALVASKDASAAMLLSTLFRRRRLLAFARLGVYTKNRRTIQQDPGFTPRRPDGRRNRSAACVVAAGTVIRTYV